MRRIASAFAASLLSLAACESDSTTTTPAADVTVGTDTATSGGTDTSTPGGTDTSTGGGTDTATGGGTGSGTNDGVCPGISNCATECQDQACLEACVNKGDSQAEADAFVASYTCPQESGCVTWGDAQPTNDQIKDYIRCIGANCIDEEVACAQGATGGTGTCTQLPSCLQECGEGEYTCDRACFAAASSAAVTAFIDVNICASAECYGVAQANRQTCIQQAIGSGGPCNQKYTTCFGNVGAGASWGGAGGFGKAFFMPFSFAFGK